ncbi:hypothetical protein ABER68_04220 [Paenibacillus alvei]
MNGELHDNADKRIKRCDYCGYFYRDKTKPNNSRTCSKECKTNRDTLQRAMKKADQEIVKPQKKESKQLPYVYWLEYPYWVDEYEMLKYSWKYEAPYPQDKLEQIEAAQLRDETTGGKRKPKCVVPYSGINEGTGKVTVRFAVNTCPRKPSEVIISKLSVEELDEYYRGRYSKEHLKQERRRAMLFSRSKKV